MEKNDIKKELYKQKPVATLAYIRKGIAVYETTLKDVNPTGDSLSVFFEVPVSDMGDATFNYVMDAKLLIRWII
jgi:hypothetical protein